MNAETRQRVRLVGAAIARVVAQVNFGELFRDVLCAAGVVMLDRGVDIQFGRGYALMAGGAILLFLVLARRK